MSGLSMVHRFFVQYWIVPAEIGFSIILEAYDLPHLLFFNIQYDFFLLIRFFILNVFIECALSYEWLLRNASQCKMWSKSIKSWFSGVASILRMWIWKKSGYNDTLYSIYSLKAKKGHPWMIDDCTNLRNDIVFRRQTSWKTHFLKSLGKTVIRDF